MAQYDPIAIKSGILTVLGTDSFRDDRIAVAGLDTTTNALVSGDVCQVDATALRMKKAVNTSTSPIVGIFDGETNSVVRKGIVVATMKAGVVLANGDTVWLSSTAGALTNVKPTMDMLHEVGVVVDAASKRVLLQQKPVIAQAVSPIPPSSGMRLWLQGDKGVAQSGGLVSTWTDQTIGRIATGSPAPLYHAANRNGLDTVGFRWYSSVNELSHRLLINRFLDLGSEAELIVYFRPLHDGGWTCFATTGDRPWYTYNTVEVYDNFGGTERWSYTPPIDLYQWHVYNVSAGYAANNYKVYWNNVLRVTRTGTRYADWDATGSIGQHFYQWYGDIAEMIVYQGLRSDEERATIYAYLVAKWGAVGT